MISFQNTASRIIASLFILAKSIAAQTVEPRKLIGTINEESSWSPDGKTIAFDSIRSGKLNICPWRIDTCELKRITTTEANDFTPEWSPAGKEIAFVSDRTGHNEIFIIDLTGGMPRQVTKNNSDAIHPHWSPDGRQIIYCSARDNPNQASVPGRRGLRNLHDQTSWHRCETDHARQRHQHLPELFSGRRPDLIPESARRKKFRGVRHERGWIIDAKFDERSGTRWMTALVPGWKANRVRIEPREQNRLRNLCHEC